MAQRKPESLGSIFGQSRELRTPKGQVSLETWRAAVGPRIAERTRAERLIKGTLWVRVSSSAWAQELSLQSELIISRLQAAGIKVEALRFRVDGETRSMPVASTVVTPKRASLPAPLQERIAKLEDPELRAAISDAAALSIGRRRR